uniref:Major facilitator superfamily (MFS) profile domain-containing protein n=1 Tax=Craspedostauros australis TaxID=1486917 RepID=A0A7R9ZK49_9STRA|mmetsp:Transcript_10526/g.29018  ORF Transcript_10526/g.29018 Transcript_10526/m.29018 type:complete len:500 (+) Transcript_10526:204-1703(+)|eukprot:CAMPEP_0198128554 /NCGR_PEP_ID=MMETSP1442-20131203/49631_1 /TAXON_ID= /ORGANISM="Craspedostauros australis, Strain CCMP3328" /LENGTH=499 /DNA_ID=CAMNT_0043788743 /DNA_START=175 /DNA_END=1674 /DNA_ORIENTATION=+
MASQEIDDRPKDGEAGSASIAEAETEPLLTTIFGVMGNVLEWYDFALFGFFSDIISDVFFPEEDEDDEHSNLIKSFAIFGSAFLMRPIGGMLIGYVGDKHGRKHALTRSLFLMAIPTTLMGLLPTYDQVGGLAIVLLVLCRLLQGISVGGQLPASLVYTVEKRDPAHWGYYGALPMVAANCGTLLGNLCGAFMREILTQEQLRDFGWRLPFFSGIIIAFVACYLSRHGQDVHTNANVYDSETSEIKNPLRAAFRRENRLALFSTSLGPMLWAAGFYLTYVWLAIYMEELLDPSVTNAFWVNACSLFFGMTFMLPIAGHASDRLGRIRTMTVAALALMVAGPIMLVVIARGGSFAAFLAQWSVGVMLSFFGAPLCAWLVESFDSSVRLTSASLGYDLAHAIAAGYSPAMATALFKDVGKYAPGMLYTIFGFLSLVGIYTNHFCGGKNLTVEGGDASTTGSTNLSNNNGISSANGTGNGDLELSSNSNTPDENNVPLPQIS